VQQVLLVVLQSLREGKVNDVDNVEPYIFGTCRNMAMSMRRGDFRQQRIADETAKALPQRYRATRTALRRAATKSSRSSSVSARMRLSAQMDIGKCIRPIISSISKTKSSAA
jgi:hypothetical protein